MIRDHSRNKQAVIVNAYSYRNAGDAAIMISTAQLLSDLGFSTIRLSTRYVEDAGDYSKWNVGVIPPLVHFPVREAGGRLGRVLVFLVDALLTCVVLALPTAFLHHKLGRWIVGTIRPRLRPILGGAIPVIAGGGYLYSSKRRVNLSLLHSLLTIWVCRRMARDVLVMPASVGPIHRSLDRNLVQWVCKTLGMVLREERSLAKSSKLPKLERIRVCPDVAFYGNGERRSAQSERSPRVVRIVLMDWKWSNSVDSNRMARYVVDMAKVVDGLVDRGFTVELGGHSVIPEHGQDDLVVCEEVAAAASSLVVVDRNADVGHLWNRYQEVDVVLGTRLHACIMAVSVATPCVVLAYQEKGEAVMAAADIPARVFRVDNLDPIEVLDAVEESMSEKWRGAVAAQSANARKKIVEIYGGE